jgi:hypothetical protein
MKKIIGRPKGQNKTSRLEIMINPEIKKKFVEITKQMGSNPSVKINEMIIQFIKQYGDDKNEKQ